MQNSLPNKVVTNDRQGAMLYLIALSLLIVMWFVILAVDIGLIAAERSQSQVAADAAAVASIQSLFEAEKVQEVAEHYARLNYAPAGDDLSVTTVRGFWNEDTKVFTGGSVDGTINAVQVTVTRESTPLLFGRVMGYTERDITSTAVAVDRPKIDSRSGMISGNRIFITHNVVQDNFVVYGRRDVRYGNNVSFLNGSKVGALKRVGIRGGQYLSEHIIEARLQPVLANNVKDIIDNLINRFDLPQQISRVEYYPVDVVLPDELEEGTAYVFENSILIDQEYDTKNVIIASRENISWESTGIIRNTADSSDGVAIGIFAGDEILVTEGAIAEGVELIGGYAVRILHGTVSFIGAVQAGELAAVGTGVVLQGSPYSESISVAGFSGSSSLAR